MSKPKYAFLLGNNPALSLAEILAVFKDALLIHATEEFAILEIEKKFDAQVFLDTLGGTIKIYEIINQLPQLSDDDVGGISKVITSLLIENRTLKKMTYAINVYGSNDKQFQKELILETKHRLKHEGISSRFVNQDFKNTTSVQSFHENLVDKGTEVVVFFNSNLQTLNSELFIGTLVASQNIEEYSKRDFDKPSRNMKVGLMPPKLAQIMVNLAGLPIGKTIYDPFCGTGGILTEALLTGYKIFGSDINENVVKEAQNNIAWILKETGKELQLLHNIFIQDAMKFDRVSFPYDAIVTESYLGPVIEKPMREEDFDNMENHLLPLYISFFTKLKKRITNNIPIIICFPVFYTKDKPLFISKTLAQIEALGYTASALLPENIEKQFKEFVTDHHSIVYHREGQLVGREIFELRNNKK